MNKSKQKTITPKIPAALVAYIHGVTRGAVTVSKCNQDKYYPKYQETEGKIISALEQLRLDRTA